MKVPFVSSYLAKRKEDRSAIEEIFRRQQDRARESEKACTVFIEIHGEVGKQFEKLWSDFMFKYTTTHNFSASDYKMNLDLKASPDNSFNFIGGFLVEFTHVENKNGKAVRFELKFDRLIPPPKKGPTDAY